MTQDGDKQTKTQQKHAQDTRRRQTNKNTT